jgi:hypothetical protein
VSCHACENDCKQTFVCECCGHRLNVCIYLVGGFERIGEGRLLCSRCRDVFLPRDWHRDLSPSMQRKKTYADRVYAQEELLPTVGCS